MRMKALLKENMSKSKEAIQIEANVANVISKFTPQWANHMAARYDGPVYLVGSILHNPNPRDYDIRILVEDTDFAARYGMALYKMDSPKGSLQEQSGIVSGNYIKWYEDGPSQRWIDDIAKFGSHLSRIINYNIDFQVWPKSHWRTPYPDPILLAEPSSKWFFYNKHCPDPSKRKK